MFRSTALCCAVLLLTAGGCAGTPKSPFFGDERYLRFGLDMGTEADDLVKQHADRGKTLLLRLSGHHFTALGFASHTATTQSGDVRIVTARGIAVALDADEGSAVTTRQAFALLPAPLAATHDADGDGFEEVFVSHSSGAEACVLVYRVRDVGFVDAVPVRTPLFGVPTCPSGVDDLEGDGRAELYVDLPLRGFLGDPPSVRVPLFASDHRFAVDADRPALQRFLTQERARRMRELGEARTQLDVMWAMRLGVELAALIALGGGDVGARVSGFDEALRGLVLHPDEASALLAAREQIGRWPLAIDSPDETATDKNATP